MASEKQLYEEYLAESLTSTEIGWKKRLDVKEWDEDMKMTVHSRKQKGRNNDLFRMDLKIRNHKLEDMTDYLLNPPLDKLKMYKEFKIDDMWASDDKSEYKYIRYQRTTAPMITDRDAVVFIQSETDANGQIFSSTKSILDERYPERNDTIRMYNHDIMRVFTTSEDGVEVLHFLGFLEFDVKGMIPVGLLNMSAANNIFKFFHTMMEILNGKK